MKKMMNRKLRLTYGAEGDTDYFEGRFFFAGGKLYTYAAISAAEGGINTEIGLIGGK